MPPWNVAEGGLLGHGAEVAGAAAAGGDGNVVGEAEEGGSHVCGNDGALMVDGAGATAAPGTVDTPPPGRATGPCVVVGAVTVPAPAVPVSGIALGK